MGIRFDEENQITRPVTANTQYSSTDTIVATKEGFCHRSRLGEFFLSDVEERWADILLIVCCYVGGLVDGLSYNFFGSFCNMQTGNAIFIALGVAGKPDHPDMLWAKALIAIFAFLIGNFVYIYGSRLLGPNRRLTHILSFALQTAMLLAAAILVQLVDALPDDPRTVEWRKAVVISLLSFQSAGQMVASRILGYAEIPTVVLTVLVCDLFMDTKLYQGPWKSNPKRNRRIGALLMHFFGAMTAGGMAKTIGLEGGLWYAMSLKACVTIAWFFWRKKSI